jgi:hypothetical protein
MPDLEAWCRVTLIDPFGAKLASWSLTGPGPPDLSAVDYLARLCLLAARAGLEVVVSDLAPALARLLDLVGLGPVSDPRRSRSGPGS